MVRRDRSMKALTTFSRIIISCAVLANISDLIQEGNIGLMRAADKFDIYVTN